MLYCQKYKLGLILKTSKQTSDLCGRARTDKVGVICVGLPTFGNEKPEDRKTLHNKFKIVDALCLDTIIHKVDIILLY